MLGETVGMTWTPPFWEASFWTAQAFCATIVAKRFPGFDSRMDGTPGRLAAPDSTLIQDDRQHQSVLRIYEIGTLRSLIVSAQFLKFASTVSLLKKMIKKDYPNTNKKRPFQTPFLSTVSTGGTGAPNVQPPDRSFNFRSSTKMVTTEAGLMMIILSAASPCLMIVSPVKKTWELHLVRKVFRNDFEKPLKNGCSSKGSGASSLNLFSAISRKLWHASEYWSSNANIPLTLTSTILQTVNALMVASRSCMPAKLNAPEIPPTK